jgi:hypothetical protein
MALAPVDFYAYSRATGVPVPEDPEERAALVPEVVEFRRNQLRAPQQESQLPGILGAAALGLGILGAGAVAARRFGRGIPKAAKPKVSGINVTDLETVARANIPTPTPAPSKVVVPESAIPQATFDLNVLNQAKGALESGEDQITGRIMRGVQRNEDIDSSQVSALNQTTNNAAVSTSFTPDSIPEDQTDVQYFFREKQFLLPGQRLQERAQTVAKYQTPTSVSVIGRYPAITEDPQNIARFPGSFGSSSEGVVTYTPAYGGVSNVIQREGVEFSPIEGRIEGAPARFTALPRGTKTEGLLFQMPISTVPLTEEQALQKINEFQISKEFQIKDAMERGLSAARARRNVQVTPSQQQAIEAVLPTYSPEDVMSQPLLKVYGDVAQAERFTEEQASKSGRIEALEQGGFLEKQVDPGELRVEPKAVRPGVMIQPASKTSYRGVTGRPGFGIYGEQAGGRAGEPVFGSGAVEASKIIKTEGEERGITTPRRFIPGVDDPTTRTPEGFVYTEEALEQPTKAIGGYKRYGTQPPTPKTAAKESLNVSSELLRIQKEQGPAAAQAFLDKMKQERQISAIGASQPLRQRMTGTRFTG